MKLKEFNTENSKTMRVSEPVVRISTKSGVFSFNGSASELLELATNKVVFVQDELSLRDWYIKKSNADNAFTLRMDGKSVNVRYDFNSTHLAKRVMDSLRKPGKNYQASTFRIQQKPVEMEGVVYYLLITANMINPSEIEEKN